MAEMFIKSDSLVSSVTNADLMTMLEYSIHHLEKESILDFEYEIVYREKIRKYQVALDKLRKKD